MQDVASDARVLRAVVDTAADGVILIDQRGTIQMFNPACERLFQYSAAEVLGRNVKILMPPPFRDAHDGYIDNYMRTGEQKIIGIGREVVGQRRDGSTFPMHLSVGEAKLDSGTAFVGIIHDLSERERNALAIRESAERLQAVVATAVDGVILIDSVGTVLMFNPACERLFGYHADEVIGKNVKLLMPEPFRSGHDGYLANYRRTGERKIIGIGREVIGQRKDGSTFPMDLSVGEARQQGAPVFVGVIHDLTERKRMEEQLVQAQKMEAVGQLSGGIAHDFNNLLTVIIGNASLLSDRLKARPDLKRQVDDIVAAGERGAELTQRLLAFGRRQTLRPREVDCNSLVNGMQNLLRRAMREDIRIKIATEAELPPAFCDPSQLENTILNLALNAQDAMPKGGNLIMTTAHMPLEDTYRDRYPEVIPGHYVLISVTDDGEGMPPEVLEHVFEPFFTTKEVGKGTGLGLSMVYGFIKQSGGHVSIYSEPGLGTTVRMYLPVSETAALASRGAPPQPEPELSAAPGGRERILVAEDDPFVRAFAIGSLESLGYEVIPAIDGHEALARLGQEAQIDLLFTDIVMPGGLNGWELADRARQLKPGLKVLLTSGYAVETLSERGRIRPGTAFLNKPYRKADLAASVRDALDGLE